MSNSSASLRRAGAAVIVLLLGAYGLPLFFPPAAVPSAPPVPDTPFVQRLFPGVPSWWVLSRLLCLLGAALAAAVAMRGVVFAGLRGISTAEWRVAPAFLYAAGGIAALQVLAACWARSFTRPLQLLYVAAFGLPALVIWLGEREGGRAHGEASGEAYRFSRRSVCAVAGMMVLWAAWRVPATWRSFRGADFVDANPAYERLVEAAHGGMNLVSSGSRQSSIHLVFQGAGLVSSDVLLDWGWLQAVAVFWLLISAWGVGYLATRLVGRWSAPVAVAAFLFSPFVLSVPFSVVPFGLGPAFTVALLSLMVAIERQRRPSAIAAMGAVAALSALLPPITPMAVAVVALCAWSLSMERRREAGGPVAIAAVSILAAALPSLPSAEQLRWMALEFSSARVPWSTLEAALFGQLSLAEGESAFRSAEVAAGDLVVSALLTPFAIPRTAIRLWGDALFDPAGAGLAAIGLAACAFQLRRDRTAAILFLLLLVALVTVAPSSYDRPSLARLVTAPAILALFSAGGFEVLRRLLGARSPAALALLTTAAVAAGGGVLFDAVNPRILARSAVGISLTALERTPPSQSVILARDQFDPQWSGMLARLIPREPREVVTYRGAATLDVVEALVAPAAVLWSPGLEDEEDISTALCGRWPSAALYTLYDPPRLSRAFAASPHGPHWQPALPRTHWTVAGCDARLETEGRRAAAALAAASALIQEGRRAEAVEELRWIALRSFVQPSLYGALAELLLQAPQVAVSPGEAIYWARRATQSKNAEPRAFTILASAYAGGRRFDQAAAAARQGAGLARRRSEASAAAELEELARFYERQTQRSSQ